jgi:hypothetical protein
MGVAQQRGDGFAAVALAGRECAGAPRFALSDDLVLRDTHALIRYVGANKLIISVIFRLMTGLFANVALVRCGAGRFAQHALEQAVAARILIDINYI